MNNSLRNNVSIGVQNPKQEVFNDEVCEWCLREPRYKENNICLSCIEDEGIELDEEKSDDPWDYLCPECEVEYGVHMTWCSNHESNRRNNNG